MKDFLYYLIFALITIYILLKTIGYAIYEIKENKNKTGGIIVVAFSTLVVIFANVMMWIK